MAFSITEIQAAINSAEGVLTPAHFYAVITPSTSLRSTLRGIEDIRLFCDSALLPGIQFNTTDIKPYGYGLTERRPVETNYGTLSLSFMCDASGIVMDLMHKWMQNIQNINARRDASASVAGMKVYEYQYPEKYEAVIDLYVYNTRADEIILYKMFGCFPMNLRDAPVSWNMSDQILKVDVEFSYNYWVSPSFSGGSMPTDPNDGRSASNRVNSEIIDVGYIQR